jgi:hypothetical protein
MQNVRWIFLSRVHSQPFLIRLIMTFVCILLINFSVQTDILFSLEQHTKTELNILLSVPVRLSSGQTNFHKYFDSLDPKLLHRNFIYSHLSTITCKSFQPSQPVRKFLLQTKWPYILYPQLGLMLANFYSYFPSPVPYTEHTPRQLMSRVRKIFGKFCA